MMLFHKTEVAHATSLIAGGAIAASIVQWLPWALGILIAVLSVVVQISAWQSNKAKKRESIKMLEKTELEIKKLKEE